MTTDSGTFVRADDVDDATVALSVHVDAVPGRVFAAFTDPAQLVAWFWPERLATRYETDVRDGGTFTILSETGGMGVRGTYLEVTPPRRLVLTWLWDGERTASEVLVEISEAGAGSEVVLTHGGNPTVEARDLHRQGWIDCLGRLADHFGAGRVAPTAPVE